MNIQFKDFFKEGRGGGPDHQTIGRMMNPGFNRKHQNFRAQGPKPKINPIVDNLIKNKSTGKILKNKFLALSLLRDYNIKHINVPYTKALKNTGYWIKYNPAEDQPVWIIFKK